MYIVGLFLVVFLIVFGIYIVKGFKWFFMSLDMSFNGVIFSCTSIRNSYERYCLLMGFVVMLLIFGVLLSVFGILVKREFNNDSVKV